MRYIVTVKPGSSREEIIKTAHGELTVYLRAKPHDGEANKSLIGLLADYFDVPKTSIAIRQGSHSRTKIVEF